MSPIAATAFRFLALASVLALWSADARSQTILYQFQGGPNEFIGHGMAGLGDLNADGFADFAVSTPFRSVLAQGGGAVEIISGANGTPLMELFGTVEAGGFGYQVRPAGDVDADGIGDLVVTDIVLQAHVFSGADGSLLHMFVEPPFNTFLQVAGAGDVNADGYGDVLVSATVGLGRVRVCSGLDGAVLHEVTGTTSVETFGRSVAGLGDVDGDGFDDFLVGTQGPGSGNLTSGWVRAYSGQTGAILHTITPPTPFDSPSYGTSAAAMGDVDGDGVGDYIVGSPGLYSSVGLVDVRSGATGALIFRFQDTLSGGRYGSSVASAGDVDQDGIDDLLIGSPGTSTYNTTEGRVQVRSGAEGAILFTFEGENPGGYLGDPVTGLGDVDGDGFLDLGFAASNDDTIVSNGGQAYAISGRCLPNVYCTAKVSLPACFPRITAAGVAGSSGSPSAFRIEADRILPQKSGLLFYGVNGATATPFLGGTLCVVPPLRRTPVQSSGGQLPVGTCSGAYSFDFQAWMQSGADPALAAGQQVNAQWWYRDPFHADGSGVGLTNALEWVICL